LTLENTGLYLAPAARKVGSNAALGPRFVCWGGHAGGAVNKRNAMVAGALLWVSCSAPPPDASRVEATATPDSLPISVTAEVGRDSVRFVLLVTNPTERPIQLEFGSAQRYDFEVRNAAGAEVWRWSADQMFAQVVGEEQLAPGASLTYQAVWRPAQGRGRYRVVGRLTTLPRAREQQADFEV
jgi:intracellular proteinase inhibitor BsuPI